MVKKATFETSKQLRRLFNEQFEQWQKRERLGLADLADRCGVSSSYLSHVRRYGRVPGKPVLIHLAFNFGLENPQLLYDAAGVDEPWPHDPDTILTRGEGVNPGFISFKVDMKGLGGAIRDIVRSELEPKSLDERLKGSPLRMGINVDQTHFFDFERGSGTIPAGFFRDLFELLQTALGVEIKPERLSYTDYVKRFDEGTLDVYGPIMQVPRRLAGAIYVTPFCEVSMMGLWRLAPSKYLDQMPRPAKMADLKNPEYQIAVLKNSSSHDYANTVLQRPDDSLLICDSPEETFERATMSGVRKPAHVLLVPALVVEEIGDSNLEPLFSDKKPRTGYYPDTFAVRADWPELASRINEAIRLIARQGTIQGLFERWFSPEQLAFVRIPGRDPQVRL